MEKLKNRDSLHAETGFVLVFVVSFLIVISTFLIKLVPLCKRVLTEIEVQHAVDVATIAGVHSEVEALNFVARLNQSLAVIYAIVGADMVTTILLPSKILISADLLTKLSKAAKAIAKLQDITIKTIPFNISSTIFLEKNRWTKVVLLPLSFALIPTKRTTSPLPGILPGFLELEKNADQKLRIKVTVCKNNFCAFSKGEPEGESLYKSNWRSKKIQ